MLGRRSIPQYTGRLLFKDHKQLTESQWKYLRLFTAYCHYDVREDLAEQAEDPVRTATGLPLGKYGCFLLDSGVFNLMPIQQQSYTLIHGHYKSRPPLVVFLGGGFKSFTNCHCQWTASLDGRGIEWRKEDPIYDSAEIETQMWWLQFLVKSLLLEQWGLEAEGEIWFKGHNPTELGRLFIDDEGTVIKEPGLERRRLLFLAVLAAQPGPHLPAEIVQHICKLAEFVL